MEKWGDVKFNSTVTVLPRSYSSMQKEKCDKNNSKEKSKKNLNRIKSHTIALLLTVANLFPVLDSADFLKFACFPSYTFISCDSLSFLPQRPPIYLRIIEKSNDSLTNGSNDVDALDL